MNAYERALHAIEQLNDPALLQAYQQYATRLESVLSPEELDTYVAFQQRDSVNPRPEEQIVTDKIAADPEIGRLYQQYLDRLSASKVTGDIPR